MNAWKKKTQPNNWDWFWKAECDDLRFDSLQSFQKDPNRPIRLGTLVFRDNKLFLNLPSFKRACLAVPFFHKTIDPNLLKVTKADFINKVFGLDERLPHGYTELFKEEELEKIVSQRLAEYQKVEESVEKAAR